MARIINVIHVPHLVSYKPMKDSKYRCCTVCNYKVMIETDEGQILVASELDDFTIQDFDIDEAIMKLSDKRKQCEDFYYAVDRFVDEEIFECYVNGEIEEGEGPIYAFDRVVRDLTESRKTISDDLRKRLRGVADDIEKLLNVEE